VDKELAVVILAAGKGTRMKSKKPKVLHELMGKPIIRYILDAVSPLNPALTGLVVGHNGEQVKKQLGDSPLVFIDQEQQLGTGHALKQAREALVDFKGNLLVIYGDTPLLTTESLEKLLEVHSENNSWATVLTTDMPDPHGYGRIIRSENGEELQAIVEQKDLEPSQQQIQEINSGTYVFRCPEVFSILEKLDTDNKQGEYYLTDIVHIWAQEGKKNYPVKVDDYQEVMGINDRVDLSQAFEILRGRINRQHQLNGVTIEDPANTYIEPGVKIAPDTVIRPGTILEGNTEVGENVVLGPDTTLIDTRVGRDSRIIKSHVNKTEIGPGCSVGPFAHIRPETVLQKGVKIGDFVEVKKSTIGEGSKVPHLAYVGDATLGPGCNIGAGTIFANYDGQKKHHTHLGREVFIGSNSTLVAPLRIGDRARTGAGAVVTRDVEAGVTVVGVPAKPFSKKNK